MAELTPEQLAAAREQIAAQSTGLGTPAAPVPEADVAAQLAAGQAAAGVGMGATSVDTTALLEAIQQMQARLEALEAEKSAAAGEHPVIGTARSIGTLLEFHADPIAIELGKDLLEAAQHAVKSGDAAVVEKIAGKLEKHLRRNAPAPGERWAYGQALDQVTNHIYDAAELVTPPVRDLVAVGSSRPAAQVIPGNVTG